MQLCYCKIATEIKSIYFREVTAAFQKKKLGKKTYYEGSPTQMPNSLTKPHCAVIRGKKPKPHSLQLLGAIHSDLTYFQVCECYTSKHILLFQLKGDTRQFRMRSKQFTRQREHKFSSSCNLQKMVKHLMREQMLYWLDGVRTHNS